MIKSKITLFCSIAVFMAVICFSGLTFAQVIVDNGGTGTSFTGAWQNSGGANYYGTVLTCHRYLYHLQNCIPCFVHPKPHLTSNISMHPDV